MLLFHKGPWAPSLAELPAPSSCCPNPQPLAQVLERQAAPSLLPRAHYPANTLRRTELSSPSNPPAQVLERQAAAARTALEAAQREAAELRSALAAEKQRAEQVSAVHYAICRPAPDPPFPYTITPYPHPQCLKQTRSPQAERLHREASKCCCHVPVRPVERLISAAVHGPRVVYSPPNAPHSPPQAERLHREASGAASGLQSQLGELQQQAAQLRAALDQKSAKVR